MKRQWALLIVGIAALCGLIGWFAYRRHLEANAPRLEALAFAGRLEETLAGRNRLNVRDFMIVPGAYRQRTAQEQEDFLRKALKDEISPEGLAELKRTGEYGPLLTVFPEEGRKWAKQFGVSPANCVAFKAEKNGLQAELVLVQSSSLRRVLRCNNVKQLAMAQGSRGGTRGGFAAQRQS